MREIKFRAWNKESKSFFSHREVVEDANEHNGSFDIEYLVTQQFTGFQDKNGKEVYEGDILEIDGMKVPIEFENGCFIVRYFTILTISPLGHFDYTDIEVIGNVFENPHLIN